MSGRQLESSEEKQINVIFVMFLESSLHQKDIIIINSEFLQTHFLWSKVIRLSLEARGHINKH